MARKKQKKTEKTSEKKDVVPIKPRKRPPSMLEPYRPSNLWMEFDKAFDIGSDEILKTFSGPQNANSLRWVNSQHEYPQ